MNGNESTTDMARRVCMCTSWERETGRPWRLCDAHQPPSDPNRECHHTTTEGCKGHGDF